MSLKKLARKDINDVKYIRAIKSTRAATGESAIQDGMFCSQAGIVYEIKKYLGDNPELYHVPIDAARFLLTVGAAVECDTPPPPNQHFKGVEDSEITQLKKDIAAAKLAHKVEKEKAALRAELKEIESENEKLKKNLDSSTGSSTAKGGK